MVKVYYILRRIDTVKVYQDYHVIVAYIFTFSFAFSSYWSFYIKHMKYNLRLKSKRIQAICFIFQKVGKNVFLISYETNSL